MIYSFTRGSGSTADGEYPRAGLVDVNGTLYGTTFIGGAYGLKHDPGGFGTVFSVTPYGTETVLHRFTGSGDGKYPYADLLDVNGTLYGTTRGGGKSHGTVFSIARDGTETLLYSFGSGEGPQAGLIDVKGTLYGTTSSGGKQQGGTVFSITPSGGEAVIHSFGGKGDGTSPLAGVINLNGKLYGTTNYQNLSGGYGTVFSTTQSGKETVLHSFKGYPSDGAEPQASLLNVHGTLYGTTFVGGDYGNCNGVGGCGAVFSITPSGKEKLVYSFKGGTLDGDEPQAGLIDVNGTLYGTTYSGGEYDRGNLLGHDVRRGNRAAQFWCKGRR